MANTFITPTIVAREALISLENNLVFANLVHRAYSGEFQKVGDTIKIRKPATFTAEAWNGTTVTTQSVTQSSVNVVLDTVYDVTFEVTAKQLTMDVVSFREEIIDPAMRAIAQGVDAKIAGLFVDIAGHQVVTDTPVVSDIAKLRTQLNIQKVPMEGRNCVLHPVTEASYLVLDAFLHAEKRGDTQAVKEASMGRVLGMDFYMDQNIKTHTSLVVDTAGNWGTADTAGVTVTTMIGLANSEEIAVGDVFKVVGSDKGYRVTTAGTIASTAVACNFEPATDKAIGGAAVVTFMKTHKANLAFHKNAFAFVTAPLSPPLSGSFGQESYKGLSARVVYDYNMDTKTNKCSIDLLCGVKTLDPNLAARLADNR